MGLSFTEENKKNIINEIEKFSLEQKTEGNLEQEVFIDKELKIKEINENLIKEITSLEPYGMNNPTPIFYTKELQISNIQCINFNTYFTLEEVGDFFNFEDNVSFEAVFFKRDYEGILNCGDIVNIIYELTSDGIMLIKNLEIV